MIGLPKDATIQSRLEKENQKYHDLVQGSFIDHYHNMSYKNIMGKLWPSLFCSQAHFIVKTDDDFFVDLYEMYSFTRSFKNTAQYKQDKFILCPLWTNMQIERDPNSKWYVPFETIPKRGDQDIFLPYCAGALHITNPGTANKLVEVAKKNKFFWIDDAWVTGYLADKLNIEHIGMEYFTLEPNTFLFQKIIQSPYKQHADYICGPMLRNFELSTALSEKSRWCHKHDCLNDIFLKYKNS